MKTLTRKILLIVKSAEKNELLSRTLFKQNYLVESESNAEVGIQKVIMGSFDLIICQNEMGEYNGFKVYKILENYLLKRGIPFFLLLDKFENEDILLGLEMGIDNFIIEPFEELTLKNKIDHHIRKSKELNVFEAENFRIYFDTTTVAMFTTSGAKLDLVNDAFRKIFNMPKVSFQNQSVEDIFMLFENKENKLKFRKQLNGLSQRCCIKGVLSSKTPNILFDIHFSQFNHFEAGKMFAVVVLSEIDRLDGKNDVNINNIHKPSDVKYGKNGEKQGLRLTEREIEVLELSAQGMPIKQIAPLLRLSERTVETHRANIMGKTCTNNIIEAILIAQKNHFLLNNMADK